MHDHDNYGTYKKLYCFREARALSPKALNAFQARVAISYSLTTAQIRAVVVNSAYCYYSFLYECYHATFESVGWQSYDGTIHAANENKIFCGGKASNLLICGEK